MKLNIICNDEELLRYFKRYILTPFKVLNINIAPILEKYTIFIGNDPTPDTEFPLVDRNKNHIELPFNYIDVFGREQNFIYKDCLDNMHEVFHVIHFNKLLSSHQWNKWGIETGNKVCLEYINPRIQTPSYEKFAWDGAELFNFNLKQWYIDFLGGKVNNDYRIAHAAYVLLQSGLMSKERAIQVKEAILDKYIDRV